MTYFEIYKNGKLTKRGTDILNELSWSVELMEVPTMDVTLPVDYLDYLSGREEMKIHSNGKIFWGIVMDLDINKAEETIDVTLNHIVHEWTYRQISVNNAIKDKKVNIVFKGSVTKKADGVTITANPFNMGTNEVTRFTDAQYVARAGASAWSGSGDKQKISVDDSKVKNEKGEYDVTFSSGKASVTVKATVQSDYESRRQKTETNKANKETIGATPLTISVSRNYTAEKVKSAVNARAWVYRKKKQKVAVTSIYTNFKNQEGTYDVTAKTAKGTSITVQVKVVANESQERDAEATVADNLSDIYADTNFAYPGWELNFEGDAGDREIDYVYSKQNKLDALTETCELTEDLFWRVDFSGEKRIDIGVFGEKKPYIVSKKPVGETNIQIVEEPTIDYDFENVINLATVYAQKSDSGMSSLTLREVYNDPKLQIEGFPVVILRANVNNERDYTKYSTQYPKLAPNNELEFAVIDEESVALEAGNLIEDSYEFNDLGSFNTDSKNITDEDRIKASVTAYKATIRKLKQARRSKAIELVITPLPKDIKVGDKIRLLYDNSIFKLEACSNYEKKILLMDDWFYITKIGYEIHEADAEVDSITLEKFLKTDRESKNN